MFGLPEGLDLSFLVGVTLEQVSFGPHQLVLRFGNKVSLSVETEVRIASPSQDALYFDIASTAAAVVALISAEVTDVSYTTDGTLTLEFSSVMTVVTIYDSSKEYESYQLYDGDTVYVV